MLSLFMVIWLWGLDLNQRPFGYEPNELPGCSTPRHTPPTLCIGSHKYIAFDKKSQPQHTQKLPY